MKEYGERGSVAAVSIRLLGRNLLCNFAAESARTFYTYCTVRKLIFNLSATIFENRSTVYSIV